VIKASFDGDRIRLRGLPPGADVQIRPTINGQLPAMAGKLVGDGDDLLFRPRFGFVGGTTYAVWVGGALVAALTRPRPDREATTEVAEIFPTAQEVPRNLLRCYVWFTRPMSVGYAADNVRLVDDAGNTIKGALLPFDHELWDADHTRLTVLLDPARIKRGLVSNVEVGYALREDEMFRLVVGTGFLDAQGLPLKDRAERRYRVTDDERRRVDPARWILTVPTEGTREPLRVDFDRPMDQGLLARCLRVRNVQGDVEFGARNWSLTPHQPWAAAKHELVVDPVLEDVAGNSVARVFDRDLDESDDVPDTTVSFTPGEAAAGPPSPTPAAPWRSAAPRARRPTSSA